MARDRRARILALLAAPDADAERAELSTDRLCAVCAAAVDVAGAGIMLMAGDVQRGSICTTGPVSARIEELQYALGEGPCVDAYEESRPVHEPDLAHPRARRWPAFSEAALELGVGAVFAFPLQVGAARLGALDLYNPVAGELSADQHADALVMADIAAAAVLHLQAGARPGRVADALEAHAEFHDVEHQAAGMVAAQLGSSVAQAMIRLRAHAFGNDRALLDVARDVVARTLRFDAADERDGDPA